MLSNQLISTLLFNKFSFLIFYLNSFKNSSKKPSKLYNFNKMKNKLQNQQTINVGQMSLLDLPIKNNIQRRRVSSAKIADLRGEAFREEYHLQENSVTQNSLHSINVNSDHCKDDCITTPTRERATSTKILGKATPMATRKPTTVRFMNKNGRCNIRQVNTCF